MKFRTEIELPQNYRELRGIVDYRKGIVLTGSCFADNVGGRLKRGLMDVTVNPGGVLFNPESIAGFVSRVSAGRLFTPGDVIEAGGRFVSTSLHGSFARESADAFLDNANRMLEATRKAMERMGLLIVTTGTDIVYRLGGEVVANCHKLPGSMFDRGHLGPQGVAAALKRLVNDARSLSPNCEVIFTVSPVRHVGEGLHENQLSKAALLLGTQEVVETLSGTHYFPAYEILIDDLRDYRFTGDDMAHPTAGAVDYIYEHFTKTYCNEETLNVMREGERLSRLREHRPQDAEAHRKLIEQAVARLSGRYPELKKRIE